MHKKIILGVMLLILSFNTNAVTVTFDTATDHLSDGITLGGTEMRWDGRGGGHVYNEYYTSVASIFFNAPVTLNSVDVNAKPWENYSGGSNFANHQLTAYDSDDNQVWSAVLDLTNYTDWSNWLTVDINVANVSRLDSFGNLHWASFDNLTFDESIRPPSEVPVPAAVWLFGSVIAGFAGFRRFKTKA